MDGDIWNNLDSWDIREALDAWGVWDVEHIWEFLHPTVPSVQSNQSVLSMQMSQVPHPNMPSVSSSYFVQDLVEQRTCW